MKPTDPSGPCSQSKITARAKLGSLRNGSAISILPVFSSSFVRLCRFKKSIATKFIMISLKVKKSCAPWSACNGNQGNRVSS